VKACFRLDANKQIGLGHLFRCLHLAKKLKEEDLFDDIIFIGSFDDQSIIQLILSKGFKPIALEEESSIDLINQVDDLGLLIVDHYGIDSHWERPFFEQGIKVVVIDDINDRPHLCHLLIDQSFGKTKEAYETLVNSDCELLVGASFALLAEEFSSRRGATTIAGELKKILISFGGVDPNEYGFKCLKGLFTHYPEFRDLNITLVTGRGNDYFDRVQQFLDESNIDNVEVRLFVENMAAELLVHDFVIGAGGVSTYERCCLKKASVTYLTAENQIYNIKGLSEAGATIFMGDAKKLDISSLCQTLSSLSKESLTKTSIIAGKVTDGFGVSRVFEKISDLVRGLK
jgi:UDP-2,4-diacetamido-2,4,6-trideoxy-beta-L-altropyranose hydrolase